MNKCYHYDKKTIASKYLLLLILMIPFHLLIVFSLGAPPTDGDWFTLSCYFFLLLLISFALLAIVFWIVNVYSTRIKMDECGIYFKSLTRNFHVEYTDILEVEYKFYYPNTFLIMNPPKDLRIRLMNRKAIKILNFLVEVQREERKSVSDSIFGFFSYLSNQYGVEMSRKVTDDIKSFIEGKMEGRHPTLDSSP